VFSQNIEVKFVDSLHIESDTYFGRDILGYDYFSQKNVLYKQKKTEKNEYKNLSLGGICSIDFINPLKIMLFYKNFNSTILLDNQLTEITQINFYDFNILAQSCSTASQNRFWIYDGLSNSLLLFDYINKKIIPVSQPFKNTFKYFQSDYNQWFMVSEDGQLFRYNNYGNVFYIGNIPKYDKIKIVNSTTIIFSNDNDLYLYQIENKNTTLLISDKKNIKNINYKNEILSVFTNKTIENYIIKLP